VVRFYQFEVTDKFVYSRISHGADHRYNSGYSFQEIHCFYVAHFTDWAIWRFPNHS